MLTFFVEVELNTTRLDLQWFQALEVGIVKLVVYHPEVFILVTNNQQVHVVSTRNLFPTTRTNLNLSLIHI